LTHGGNGAPNPDHHPKEGVLYIGIDLGTSRTAVSASNGVRECVLSFVGYPRDVVSMKLFKKDRLFGLEAQEKRLSLRLYRPLERGVIKGSSTRDREYEENLSAARDLVKHAVELARPRKDELVYGVIGAPAQASIENKEAIIDATKGVLDSVMLCSEPFAVAYGLDMLEDVLVIDIGAGTTDLCRMYGAMPAEDDQITLDIGGDSVDQALMEGMRERCRGADFNIHMVKKIKEKYAFVNEIAEPVIVHLPVKGKPTPFDVTDEVRKACRSLVGPIVDAVHQLIASFDPEFQHKLRQHILLGGGGSQIRGLGLAIEEEMRRKLGESEVHVVEEPIYAGANGALKIAHDMPEDYWQRLR
jgi:rod shape-determining protein MreB